MSTQEAPASFALVEPGALGQRRALLLSGALSSLVYVANVVVGGLLTPGYSPVSNAVSELTQAGSPYAVALGVPYVVSGLLLAAFGVAVCLVSYRTSRRVFTGGLLIGLFAVQAVLLGTVFPQDPLGAPPTFPGTMHLVLVGVSVPLIVSAILLIGFGLDRSVSRWRHFRLYSVVAVLLMFAGGVLTPISIANDVEVLGLAERITQVAYLTWFTLFSIQAYRLGGIGSNALAR
jgi:hypothetical membrane protein